jgi:hypothetical protein
LNFEESAGHSTTCGTPFAKRFVTGPIAINAVPVAAWFIKVLLEMRLLAFETFLFFNFDFF